MKAQSYNLFWQRIHRAAESKGFPLRVMLELTYRCNFYCRHCYVPQGYKKRKGELKTKEMLSILDQLRDIGCFYLGLTGGEPFLRKDIMDILWYAKRKGFQIIIYTNGSLIDEKIADQLAALRPNKVDVTIPAISEGAFERITQSPGSHKKVFNAIDLLYKRKVVLGFKTCVLKENESEIEDIRKFAQSLCTLHRLDDMLSPRLDGSKEPYRYRGQMTEDRGQKSEEETCIDIEEASDCNFQSENRTPKTENLFKCGVGISQAAITPFGELKMCLMIGYSKYKILDTDHRQQTTDNRPQKVDLKDAWERLKELVAAIKPDENYQCDRCELKSYCNWCPAKAWLNDKSFTTCDPESRAFAEARRQRAYLICGTKE